MTPEMETLDNHLKDEEDANRKKRHVFPFSEDFDAYDTFNVSFVKLDFYDYNFNLQLFFIFSDLE